MNEFNIDELKSGDHFTEHYSYYVFILDVDNENDQIKLLTANAPCNLPEDCKTAVLTKEEFLTYYQYNSPSLTDKLWVNYIGNNPEFTEWLPIFDQLPKDENILKKLNSVNKPPNLLVEMYFGSHLYGTNTPSSDMDYKGIVLPTKNQILLQQAKFHIDKSTNKTNIKNTNQDIDREYYSLQYFIDLACKGETVTLDMLHAPKDKILFSDSIWDYLVDNKSKFYTKSMKAYLGYVRKQAAKYGIKGSRLNLIQNILKELDKYSKTDLLKKVMYTLPNDGDNVKLILDTELNMYYYEVFGKRFNETVQIKEIYNSLLKHYQRYGERAKLAQDNENIDWKAIHHAFRAGYQLLHIYQDNGFTYPLEETPFLLLIKNGTLDFQSEVNPLLEELVQKVTKLSEESSYPDRVNRDFWDEFLINTYNDIITK